MPTLEQLDTPYERRRVIEYGVDGNKVVRHWHDVQHIAGPLYKSKEEKNKYGEQEMDLYLFFEGGKEGLLYQYSMRHLEQYTPEKMMEEIERVGYDTLEHFLTTFDQSVVEGKFIGAAVIEFVRQFDTERGNRYAQHRLDYIARQEEKHRRLAAERAEKAAQKEAQRKAAEQAARAKYLGWADQMTAMRFGKVSSVLDVLIRVDGKVMTKREFVISRMKDGWTPTKKEGVVSYYGSRWDVKESKPRTEYRLAKENLTYRISKTEFNFASYLAAHPEKLSQAWKQLAICADAGGEQQAFREEAQKA